jgi:hypothetical protein
MNKAVDLFKQGELDAAIEALHTFSNKESKIASAASNNLSLIDIMVIISCPATRLDSLLTH